MGCQSITHFGFHFIILYLKFSIDLGMVWVDLKTGSSHSDSSMLTVRSFHLRLKEKIPGKVIYLFWFDLFWFVLFHFVLLCFFPIVVHHLLKSCGMSTANPAAQESKMHYLLLIIPISTFGLGTWQVKRLQWKKGLIKDLESRTTEPVRDLPEK